MAAEFLASHGIDLDEEVTLAYRSTLSSHGEDDESQDVDFTPPNPSPIRLIPNIITREDKTSQSISISSEGKIASSTQDHDSRVPSGYARLALPSLAHPHIHLDKPYLLSHEDTCHLEPITGSFEEALTLTAQAKPLYTPNALLQRGAQLLADSSRAGVTHLRGFCEVDTAVSLKCINAGVKLKKAWEKCLYVQIAAFAQDPLFSTKTDGTGKTKEDEPCEFISDGNDNLELLQKALEIDETEVIATTPYVEVSLDASRRNIDWAIQRAIEHNLHLDFHLDYNLNSEQEPLVWYVLDRLRGHRWSQKQKRNRTICLGHCTRLTLFSAKEWKRLAGEVADLPVYFIGLPTSDLFMQGRPEPMEDVYQVAAESHGRPRSTLNVLSLLQLDLNAAIGINNIGNAFTPFGSADPLHVAKWCIGIYQNGTAKATKTLYECISSRAKEAMGVSLPTNGPDSSPNGDLFENEEANLIVFGNSNLGRKFTYQRQSMEEVVWNPPPENERMVIYKGKHIIV